MKEVLIAAIEWILGVLFSLITSIIIPIFNYEVAIMIFATLNIIMGAIADAQWKFKKAFKAFIYLGGYLFLLILSSLAGLLMRVSEKNTLDFVSWITWVMIWFYAVNILKNWNLRQPENKVISFLYWVASFKIVEKIKFLKEFNEQANENTK